MEIIMEKNSLLKLFLETLGFLGKLNSNCINSIITQEEFNEQYDNIEDLNLQLQIYKTVIEKIKKIDINNIQQVDKNLFSLHTLLSNLEWHISELNDMNAKLLKRYSDSSFKKN
jgi:hypothetical protein